MIALMLDVALKPTEAVSLRRHDLGTDPLCLLDMKLGPVTTALIAPWIRAVDDYALFPAFRGAGERTRLSPLSAEGVTRGLKKRAQAARVTPFSAKRLQYTFRLLANAASWDKVDIEAVMARGRRRDHIESIDVISIAISWQDAIKLDHT